MCIIYICIFQCNISDSLLDILVSGNFCFRCWHTPFSVYHNAFHVVYSVILVYDVAVPFGFVLFYELKKKEQTQRVEVYL